MVLMRMYCSMRRHASSCNLAISISVDCCAITREGAAAHAVARPKIMSKRGQKRERERASPDAGQFGAGIVMRVMLLELRRGRKLKAQGASRGQARIQGALIIL